MIHNIKIIIDKIINVLLQYKNTDVSKIANKLNLLSNVNNSRQQFIWNLLKINFSEQEINIIENNINLRTIIFDDDNNIAESISLSSIQVEEMGEINLWSESSFYKYLTSKKMLFIAFKKSSSYLYIFDVFPIEFNDFEMECAKRVYLDTKNKYNKGNIVRYDEITNSKHLNFVKTSDNLCFHIRPRAKNSNDVYKTQYGEIITRQAFWLNKNIVESKYKKYINNKSISSEKNIVNNLNFIESKEINNYEDEHKKNLTSQKIEQHDKEILFIERYGYKLKSDFNCWIFKDYDRKLWLDIPIQYFNLSKRLYNCLSSINIKYLSELIKLSYFDVISIRNFGNKSLFELRRLIRETLYEVSLNDINQFSIMDLNYDEKPNKKDLYFDKQKSLIFSILNKDIDKNNIFVKYKKGMILYDIPIDDIQLSPRSFNALNSVGITTFRELIFVKTGWFLEIENLGSKSKDEIIQKIKEIVYIYETDKTINKIDIKNIETFINQNSYSNLFYNVELFKNILLNNLDSNQILKLQDSNLNDLLNENCEWVKYLEDFILYCINGSYNKFVSYKEIEDEFFSEKFRLKNLNDFLGKMIAKKLIKRMGDNYYVSDDSIIEILLNYNCNDMLKKIVSFKLKGKTLQEIGEIFNLTRERVRQLIKNFIHKNAKECWEDKFAFIFERYYFDFETFKKILNLPEMSYNYLLLKYRPGEKNIFDIVNDISIPKYIRNSAFEYFKTIALYKDGVFIRKNKNDILNYLLQKYCKDDINIELFLNKYIDFYNENNILYNEDDISLRYLENKISSHKNVLWKWKRNFRYFEFNDIDFQAFLLDIDIHRFENTEISTQLILDTTPEIFTKYNIKDKYELHNFLKKIKEIYNFDFGLKVDFLRMPNIGFGNHNREKQVENLLFNKAPISIDDLANEYSSMYGVTKQNVISNYFGPINKYLMNGKYQIDYIPFEENEFKYLEFKINKNIYDINNIVDIYVGRFPDGDRRKINSLNLDKLNYKIIGQWVCNKKFASIDNAFRSYFSDEKEIVELDDELMKWYSSGSFQNVRNNLTSEYKWIEFKKGKFLNFKVLSKEGVNLKDLEDFCNLAKDLANGMIFTYTFLINNGLDHKLIDLGFDKYFYESILKNNNNIIYRTSNTNTIFKFSENDSNLTFSDLIYQILSKILSIDIYRLIDLLDSEYGFIIDKNKLISIIKNTSLHYCNIYEKVYIDYDKYFEEI